jgi:hypothetical protein
MASMAPFVHLSPLGHHLITIVINGSPHSPMAPMASLAPSSPLDHHRNQWIIIIAIGAIEPPTDHLCHHLTIFFRLPGYPDQFLLK